MPASSNDRRGSAGANAEIAAQNKLQEMARAQAAEEAAGARRAADEVHDEQVAEQVAAMLSAKHDQVEDQTGSSTVIAPQGAPAFSATSGQETVCEIAQGIIQRNAELAAAVPPEERLSAVEAATSDRPPRT